MRSFLDVYDLESGAVHTVLAAETHLEAPNWTPDGASLIVNGDGLLYRVPLASPALHRIATGPMVHLNNDHGLSPDGATLAISDKTETGRSCIYTLPVGGGAPRRVTRQVPSWWHGWSPCGARLTYTAVREGDFCIATCGLSGEGERIVIGGPHHYDGPDYSPDGDWIWFNSDRGGTMQLWRVRPNGRDAEQMTDDDRVNWFPHPSPDGRHVVYLSYAPGTEGHPPDREVELRLIDIGTAEVRTLVSLFGGQGTLNVPCWAPDAGRFAYMRYARRDVFLEESSHA
ncbi:MAG: PD40 domain-containing protein [Roseivivax sp.]|nr:PD40 domain-containing protein [Roseivivax sp.]